MATIVILYGVSNFGILNSTEQTAMAGGQAFSVTSAKGSSEQIGSMSLQTTSVLLEPMVITTVNMYHGSLKEQAVFGSN